MSKKRKNNYKDNIDIIENNNKEYILDENVENNLENQVLNDVILEKENDKKIETKFKMGSIILLNNIPYLINNYSINKNTILYTLIDFTNRNEFEIEESKLIEKISK